MATCEVCGNDCDKPIEISLGGGRHVFDSFECNVPPRKGFEQVTDRAEQVTDPSDA